MVRPRHQDKDLEKVLARGEAQGWRVWRDKRYWKMYCPCPKRHLKMVALTPSDPNYRKNLLGQLRRATCWEEER